MSRSLIVSAFLLGFTSLLLQITLTRELLTSFLGNEISIAIVLVVWLGCVALGSGLLGRWYARRPCDATVAARHILPLSVAAFWGLLVAQLCGSVGQFPGQVIGPLRMLVAAALAL
ncbi:MAG: hypothetical protein FJX75_29450, partial [Armatimonadetes bacterium]|nr:hypothetical protein [Armatimonadota bacterium]